MSNIVISKKITQSQNGSSLLGTDGKILSSKIPAQLNPMVVAAMANILTLRNLSGFVTKSSSYIFFGHVTNVNILANLVTSTGYARPILWNGTLGTQIGSGNPNNIITVNFWPGDPSSANRAAGIMSVANGGSTPVGHIVDFGFSNNRIVFVDFEISSNIRFIGQNNSLNEIIDLSKNPAPQLVTLNANNSLGLKIVKLNSVPQLSTVGFLNTSLEQGVVDELFIKIAETTLVNNGVINTSGGQSAQPTTASLNARNNLIAKGWSIITN